MDIVTVALFAILVGFPALLIAKLLADRRRLRRYHDELDHGIAGDAVVLGVRDVSDAAPARRELMLDLRVSLPGMDPYEIRKHTSLPLDERRVVAPGDKLSVLAHPANPTKEIKIVW